jgi:O-antigen ligase
MEALKRYDTLWLDELPVHNVILWIASETGLLGLGCYLMIVFSGLKRLWRSFSHAIAILPARSRRRVSLP